jgi:hypothetical protein
MSIHNLGTIGGRATFNNRVTSLFDPMDMLRFSLSQAGSFNIGLGGLSKNVRLQLFRSSSSGSTLIGTSNNSGTTPESLSFASLPQGQYVARVQLLTPGTTPYRVRLSRLSPNDVIAEERTWSAIPTTASAHQGSLGSSNTSDLFRLNLSATTPLSLTLTGLSGDARLRLIRDTNNNGFVDAGEVLVTSTAGNLEKSINLRSLVSGTYYAQVYGTANTAYTLGMAPQASFAVREFDLGGLGSTILTRTGSVHDNNVSDIYSFNLLTTSHVSLSLTGFVGDPDLRIARDANGNGRIENSEMISYSSRRRAGVDESIAVNHLIPGNYLVQVTQHTGTSNYTLRVSSGYPTDLLPTEYDLGVLNGTRVFNGYIGSGTYYQNAADNIRFTLDSPRTVNLTLAGLANDVDLRLVRDVNNNGIVDSDEVLDYSVSGSDGAEWISQVLPAGTYFAQVYRWAGVSGDSNYYFSVSTGDWYSDHLTDPGIIGMARYFDTQSYSRRYEVMSILRAAKDHNTIDATELTDLRTFVDGQQATMPDYVHNLAYKVVNSNPANQWWTGGATTRTSLGNLYANASADHLERLIGKWFLGLDRPSIADDATYRYVSGSLVQNGIAYQDVAQGALGDCYFCAALAGVAFRRPTAIQDMFIDNGDGTYTVRFYNNGVADYVTVDRYLPSNADGGRLYMGWGGGLYNSTANELWAALAEKAYAQINESGWLRFNGSNTYASIAGGFSYESLHHLTAQPTVEDWSLTDSDRTNVINQFNAGHTVFLDWQSADGGLHALTLVGYDPTSQLFTVYNPWGQQRALTWQQILNGDTIWPRFVRWFYSTT